MEEGQLMRSMSKKGCSPDNAACEGFFGRLKTEFFYGRDWRRVLPLKPSLMNLTAILAGTMKKESNNRMTG